VHGEVKVTRASKNMTIDPQREISGEAIEAQEPMKLLKGKE
jgi:hypothetical protein